MNDADMKSLVSRVTSEVVAEVSRAETARGISISQLRDHAKDLGGGKLDSAWTISYDTSSKVTDNLGANIGGAAAWTISYDTSGKVATPVLKK